MSEGHGSLQRWLARALFAVILGMGLLFAAMTWRDRSSLAAPSGGEPASKKTPIDSYSRALNTRQSLIRELLEALGDASRKPDRAAMATISGDLIREGKAAIEPSLESLKGTREWNLKVALISILGAMREPNAIRALEDFYSTLHATDSASKQEVVRAIARVGGPFAREVLRRLLSKEVDDRIRDHIARSLVDAGMQAEELSSLTKEDRPLVEKQVLEKDAQRVRIVALEKLDPKTDSSLADLKQIVLSEKVTAIVLIAFRKLEERNDNSAVELLAARARAVAQSSDEKVVQTNALSSLARMKAVPARIAIREFVLTQDEGIRRQAISLLGSYGDEAMLPVLQEAMAASTEEDARKVAREAMVAIRSRASLSTSATKQ